MNEMHKVGWHLDNIARPGGGSWNVLNTAPPSCVLNIPGGAAPEDVEQILNISPECHVIIRPYFPPSDDPAAYENYIQNVESDIAGGWWQDVIPPGQRHLQLWNEPNMPRWSQWEGFGDTVPDMERFDYWFCQGYDRIKAIDPTWEIGWTPLTPGNRDVFFQDSPDPEHVPYYMHGPEAARQNPSPEEIALSILTGPCYNSLMRADECYAHIYCMSPSAEGGQIDVLWYGLRFIQYAKFFPKSHDVWIPECFIGDDPQWAVDWHRILDSYPAVKGTAWWRLGHEIPDVDDRVRALGEYIRTGPDPVEPPPYPWPGDDEPEPPGPPSEDLDETLRVRARGEMHKPLNYYPGFAYTVYAANHDLGAQLTNEFDTDDGLHRAQGFSMGIVFSRMGEWDKARHVKWQ